MKPGEIIVPAWVENHPGKGYRLYDIPQRVIHEPGTMPTIARLIGKFLHGETGTVLQIDEELKMVRILTSGGTVGWCRMRNLEPLEDEDG